MYGIYGTYCTDLRLAPHVFPIFGRSASGSNLFCGCSGSTLVGWLVWYGKGQYRAATADHRTGNDRTIVTERIARCKHAKTGEKSRCSLDNQTVHCPSY